MLTLLKSKLIIDQYKERLAEVKIKVLEKMKEDKRFFLGTSAKSSIGGRRDSMSSHPKRLSECRPDGRSTPNPIKQHNEPDHRE